MRIALLALSYFAAVSSLAIIIHFVVSSLTAPRHLLRLGAAFADNLLGKLYWGLLVVGWVAVVYVGAARLFFWVPASLGSANERGEVQPLRATLTVLLAIASLAVLVALYKLAQTTVQSESLERENTFLVDLVANLSSRKHTLERLRQQAAKTNAPEERILLARLHQFGEALDSQLESHVQLVLEEERRKHTEAREYEAKKAREEEQNAERVRQLRALRAAIERAYNAESIVNIRKIEDVQEATECLADPAIVQQRWDALDAVAGALLGLSDDVIKSGRSAAVPINRFFDACVGTSVQSSMNVMAAYSGNSHGGVTELYGEVEGRKSEYLDQLAFEASLEALIEAFYIAVELPKHGTFWHGWNQRDDAKFLFSLDQLLAVLVRDGGFEADGSVIGKFNRPCGIRISKSGDIFTVSCLAAFRSGSIRDVKVTIANGRVTAKQRESIFESGSIVLY